jgi:hypothetical protein
MKLASQHRPSNSFGSLHPLGIRESTSILLTGAIDMTSSKNNKNKNDTSPAADLILEAGDRIQLTPSQGLLQGLKREAVNKVWQLEYLDSYQWEVLGAPMGLVTSVRRCLEERKQKLEKKQDRRRLSPIRGTKLHRISAKVIITPEEFVIASPGLSQVSAMTEPLDGYGKKKSMSIISMDEMALSPTIIRSKSPIRSLSQQDESVGAFFPPSMPERKQSRDPTSCIFDGSFMETSEDHWTCASEAAGGDVKTPPVLPTRLASDEPSKEFR